MNRPVGDFHTFVKAEEGKLAEAAGRFQQALEIFERLGSPDAETARRSLQRVRER